MKSLITFTLAFIVSLFCLLAHAATPSFSSFAQDQFKTNGYIITAFPPGISNNYPTFGTNVLVVDPNGNDTMAATNPYHMAFRSLYNLIYAAPTNGNWPTQGTNCVSRGACTYAKQGDWIWVNPGTYLEPSIPLNIAGQHTGFGANLYISPGAFIIRATTFANTNGSALSAGNTKTGPLIIPGNGSIVLNYGNVGSPAASDTLFGFAPNLPGWQTSITKGYYGFTNWIPSSFYLGGYGTFISPSIDNVSLGTANVSHSSTASVNTNILNEGVIENLLFADNWDNFVFGAAGGTNYIRTKNLTVISTNGGSVNDGINNHSVGRWIDNGSLFIIGGTNANGLNPKIAGIMSDYPLACVLNGTRFIFIGCGATNTFAMTAGTIYGSSTAWADTPTNFIQFFGTNMLGVPGQTNFVSGQVYANGTGRPITVRSLCSITTAAVNGAAAMDLQYDPLGGTSFVLLSRSSSSTTLGVSLAQNYTNSLSAVIPSGGSYTFTNNSAGAGNSSTLITGTGQVIPQ